MKKLWFLFPVLIILLIYFVTRFTIDAIIELDEEGVEGLGD